MKRLLNSITKSTVDRAPFSSNVSTAKVGGFQMHTLHLVVLLTTTVVVVACAPLIRRERESTGQIINTPTTTSISMGQLQQQSGQLKFSPSPSPSNNTITSTPTPSLVIPDLYPGLRWTSPQRKRLLFSTLTGDVEQLDGYNIESVLVKSYPRDFIEYYKNKLSSNGWVETADASGPAGEWHGYEKDARFIMFGVRIVSESEYQAVVEHN